MSTRTILEINHDHLHRLIERPDIMRLILEELGSARHCGALNEANERGRSLDIGHGVQLIIQHHHSTDVTVTTEYQTVKL